MAAVFGGLFGSSKQQSTDTRTWSLQDSGNVAVNRTLALDNVGNVAVNVPATGQNTAGSLRPDMLILLAGVALLVFASMQGVNR